MTGGELQALRAAREVATARAREAAEAHAAAARALRKFYGFRGEVTAEHAAAREAERKARGALWNSKRDLRLARKAAKAAEQAAGVTESGEPLTHCQICARQIKSAGGVIAHHGYTRPGDGWQTASCYGARRLPYEVSRDAIPAAVQWAREAAERQRAFAAGMRASPPATLREAPDKYSRREPREATRPEGFNPAADPGAYRPYDNAGLYQMLFFGAVRLAERMAEYADRDAVTFQKRWDEWPGATLDTCGKV